jgi:hypothetical protein
MIVPPLAGRHPPQPADEAGSVDDGQGNLSSDAHEILRRPPTPRGRRRGPLSAPPVRGGDLAEKRPACPPPVSSAAKTTSLLSLSGSGMRHARGTNTSASAKDGVRARKSARHTQPNSPYCRISMTSNPTFTTVVVVRMKNKICRFLPELNPTIKVLRHSAASRPCGCAKIARMERRPGDAAINRKVSPPCSPRGSTRSVSRCALQIGFLRVFCAVVPCIMPEKISAFGAAIRAIPAQIDAA